jgi:hypothetical protein
MSQRGIDKGNIEAFRTAYEACEGETFMFEGQEILKQYAKYAIEYWDSTHQADVK